MVSSLLLQLVGHPRHQFWPESPSLLELPQGSLPALLDSNQITDTDLLALALAVEQGEVLASPNRPLISGAVDGAEAALELIPV